MVDVPSDNIDPAGLRTDAELNDCLSLINANANASSSLRDKFRLDTEVQNEGKNFSAGECQLREFPSALYFVQSLTSQLR